ncbi:TonB-dependent vitamin B12 receptor [Solilutibacter silvestris]|uniref:TonB-B12: TonB-dependent vitamin B12 receptor n=1 Tax=Solilutibacter silvestris TaxID=1645665 RepID=A0A2K1Q2T2_9GAMM|nr:TonB-dependent vitamin B12 receptor [Lysobacter silvestris]PNS09334.1 TonB-B12: TonB-dependent vitamin B12 receptor [Lysobacter silvestris]
MQPHKNPSRRALVVALALVTSSSAFAQQADDSTLGTVSVTATRSERGPASLAASTTITRADIERLQPSSLPELLRGQPGLAIYNQGGEGKLSAVFLRGTSPGQVLVMIDGVKIGSVSAGMSALQDIPVAQIERVEIVRGPMSSLYGSEAIGGVIQIFTRRPQADGVSPHVGVALGTYDTLKSDAGLDGRRGGFWYSANVAYDRTRGFNACNGDPVTFAGCGVIEPDRDGYINRSANVALGYRFNEAWKADARVMRIQGDNKYDGSWANRSTIVQQVAGAHVQYAPLQWLAIDLNAGRNDDQAKNYSPYGFVGFINTRRDSASLKADIGTRTDLATVGIDWQRDSLVSDTPYDATRRNTHALFADWRGDFGSQHLQLGARHEDNSQFGTHDTGHVAWGWDLTKALRMSANYGTAFRAPTFNDLYYPGFSNPNLRPETSRSIELGVDGSHDWGRWGVHAYRNELRDLIAFNPFLTSPSSPWGMPDNIQRARINGVEATLGTTLAKWDINATASVLDPRNKTPGSAYDNLLNRRPQRIARIDADRSFGQWSVGASINGASHRFDDPANRVRMGGYATSDLRVAYRPDAAWTLQLTAQNIFDKAYETARWYNQAGRTLMFSVRWQPKQ